MTQKTKLLISGVVLVLGLCAASLWIPETARAASACPDVANGETAEDCPWADVARSMIQTAEAGGHPGEKLNELLPSFMEQIKRERTQIEFKAAWGQSINFDEYAKSIVVDPRILDELIEKFEVSKRSDRIIHAGTEHVYGYLFSNLKTAFGYKRARWVKDDIEKGFALPKGTLAPLPSDGAFFSNITFFAAKIAFRNESQAMSEIGKGRFVADALKNFDFGKLQITRLQETIRMAKPKREVVIRTDFVPFFSSPSDKNANSQLLIYSILDSQNQGPQLITAFPVAAGFVAGVTKPDGLGFNQPIITRYNAYVDGITGTSFQGAREVHYEVINGADAESLSKISPLKFTPVKKSK